MSEKTVNIKTFETGGFQLQYCSDGEGLPAIVVGSALYYPRTFSQNIRKHPNADKFDVEIRGWTRYWNDIFSLPDPLAANLVKALIVSESSFHPETDIPARKHGRARGLMQITDSTMTALSDHHGELSNYLICFEHLKLLNPTANICCGIRWLFRKKITASAKLGRQATWIEAVADYKGILKNLPHKWMEIFEHHYLCIIEGC